MDEDYDSTDSEQLCLLQDNDNKGVYVKNCNLLLQHQINALRFLFKQFHKKLPGVVINFPPSCGKAVTVAIFLEAIDHLLKNPVLILYEDDSETKYWMEHLKVAGYGDEQIAVEYVNPFVKDIKVFLKKPVNLNSYFRRPWSIVVVRDDFMEKDILKIVFDAKFKIWISSIDVKNDITTLFLFYSWLYPKEKVNIDDFLTEKCNRMEKFKRSVLLDSFMADIVIREFRYFNPFRKMQQKSGQPNIKSKGRKQPQKSIKNKDATGTKIKRSKKSIHNVLPTHNQNDNVIENNKENKNNPTTNHHENDNHNEEMSDVCNVKSHESPKLDVESFIRDQKPLKSNQIDFDRLSQLYDKEESITNFQNTVMSTNANNLNENLPLEQLAKSLHSEIDIKSEIIDFDDIENSVKENNELIEYINDTPHTSNSIKIKCDFPQTASNLRENEVTKETVIDSKTNIGEDENTDNIKIKSEKSDKDIDDKISELEERAFKKFKGSILDSIF